MNAQQKNLAGLLVAAGIAGAVGLYAYFGVLKADEREAERKESDARLVALPGAADGGAAAEFTVLTVAAKDATTTLEHRAEGWFITAPLQARADASVVAQLTRELESGRVKEKLDDAPGEDALKRYGLSPPRFVVTGTVRGAGASKEFRVEGGIENPYDGSVYLRRGEDRAVYSAPVAVRTALERTTFELRDKQLFAARVEDVNRVELKVDGKVRYAVARAGGGWTLAEPSAGEADAETVEQLLTSLLAERVTGFPGATEEWEKRLGTPAQDVSLGLKNGEVLRLQLVKDGEKVLARRTQPEGTDVIELAPSVLGHLDRPAEELRDRTVVRFDRDAVTRVVFQPGGLEVQAERDADGGTADRWTVTAPERAPVKPWKMSTVLWALSSLKATAPGADAPRDWSRFGLGEDARRVQLYGAHGALLAELRIGSAVKGAADRVYARGSRPALFEVEAVKLTELPKDVEDLVDRPAAQPDGGLSGSSGAD